MNLSKNDIERSLLQKAVRRGNEAVVEKALKYLFSVDDTAWLKKRLFVIAYEECWTLGNELTATNLTKDYKKITKSVKNKNAAGLASLAWHCRNGDLDILQGMTSEDIDNVNRLLMGLNHRINIGNSLGKNRVIMIIDAELKLHKSQLLKQVLIMIRL